MTTEKKKNAHEECLMWSTEKGYFPVVYLLLSKVRDDLGQCCLDMALVKAAAEEYWTIVRLLIESGADIHTAEEFPLAKAIEYKNYNQISWLLGKGANINNPECTAFYHAIQLGDCKMVKFLVEQGREFKQTEYKPLEIAIETGNLEMVKLLIELGAYFEPNSKHYINLAMDSCRFSIANFLTNLIDKRKETNDSLLNLIQFLSNIYKEHKHEYREIYSLVESENWFEVGFLLKDLLNKSQNNEAYMLKFLCDDIQKLEK